MMRFLLPLAAVVLLRLPLAAAGPTPVLSADVSLHDSSRPGSGTWTQSFPTVPGQAYRLGFVLSQSAPTSGQTVQVIIESGSATPVRTEFTAPPTVGVTHSATFIASGTATSLTLNDEAGDTSTSVTYLSPLTVVALPPSLYAGHYLGNVVEGRDFRGLPTKENIASNEVRRVNLRINTAGQLFFLFEPGDEYAVGTIGNDGAATYGDTDGTHGTATQTNGILRISYAFTNRLDNNFNGLVMERTRQFTLRRVGN